MSRIRRNKTGCQVAGKKKVPTKINMKVPQNKRHPWLVKFFSGDLPRLKLRFSWGILCGIHIYGMLMRMMPMLSSPLQGLVSMSRYLSHHPTIYCGYNFQQIWLFWWCVSQIPKSWDINPNPCINLVLPISVRPSSSWICCSAPGRGCSLSARWISMRCEW